ncbi:hypothetical protein QYM36_016706, partial [Artemia franciscana]
MEEEKIVPTLEEDFGQSLRLQTDQSDELSIDNQWEKIAESLKEAAQEAVGYNRKKKEQWISESTWDIIDQLAEVKIFADRHEHNTTCTREYPDDLKAQYKRLNKQVKTRTRNVKNLVRQLQVAGLKDGTAFVRYLLPRKTVVVEKEASIEVHDKTAIEFNNLLEISIIFGVGFGCLGGTLAAISLTIISLLPT